MLYYITKDGDRWTPVASANLTDYWWCAYALATRPGFAIVEVEVDDCGGISVPPLWDDVLNSGPKMGTGPEAKALFESYVSWRSSRHSTAYLNRMTDEDFARRFAGERSRVYDIHKLSHSRP